jgi:hypothetical protein
MKVGVLGTGIVGRVLGARLAGLGHVVTIGTRDPDTTLASAEPGRYGDPPFAAWRDEHPDIGLGSFAEAASSGELVVNATNGGASIDALRAAGEENLEGKVLIDISNPLDASAGMPPSLFVSNTDSLGEQIQRAFPRTRVVKSLNTVNAYVMADPSIVAGGEHTIFVSGNDDGAKAQVSELLRSFGWRDVIDLGDITTARGAEMYVAMWVRLWGALETGTFNVSVVR